MAGPSCNGPAMDLFLPLLVIARTRAPFGALTPCSSPDDLIEVKRWSFADERAVILPRSSLVFGT